MGWDPRPNRAEPILVEPLGLIYGPGVGEAVRAGIALPLGGGPIAFTMLRRSSEPATPVSRWTGDIGRLVAPRPRWAGVSKRSVMGIVNVTPDSFSDGDGSIDHDRAIKAGQRMLEQGADLIDVGGESTRPGAEPVPPEEEQRRVLPVIAALAGAGARIVVDTRNASTMARSLDAGAAIVNDVSALRHDPNAAAVVAERKCPVILMHMRGDPRSMTGLAQYDDVARDVVVELQARLDAAEAAGIDPARVAVDPGFGFAKTADQSRELLRRLPLFFNLPCPIIAGLSRKRFVGEMAGVPVPAERDAGSVAAGLFALSRGAVVLRVHDVPATVHAIRVWRALSEPDGPEGDGTT